MEMGEWGGMEMGELSAELGSPTVNSRYTIRNIFNQIEIFFLKVNQSININYAGAEGSV